MKLIGICDDGLGKSYRVLYLQRNRIMKALISVLVESPLYFTLSLQDRYRLVRRLSDREEAIDLSGYQKKIDTFLRAGK